MQGATSIFVVFRPHGPGTCSVHVLDSKCIYCIIFTSQGQTFEQELKTKHLKIRSIQTRCLRICLILGKYLTLYTVINTKLAGNPLRRCMVFRNFARLWFGVLFKNKDNVLLAAFVASKGALIRFGPGPP